LIISDKDTNIAVNSQAIYLIIKQLNQHANVYKNKKVGRKNLPTIRGYSGFFFALAQRDFMFKMFIFDYGAVLSIISFQTF
jgi:hypothetical protein